MTQCTAAARDRVRAAARQLDTDPRVLAVDVLDPATDPTDGWTLDVIARGDSGLPSPVHSVLAEYGLAIRTVAPRGDHWNCVAVA